MKYKYPTGDAALAAVKRIRARLILQRLIEARKQRKAA